MATLTYPFNDVIWSQPSGWEVIDYGAGTPISRTNTGRYELNCGGGIYAKCTDISTSLTDTLISGSNIAFPFGSPGHVFIRHDEAAIGSWTGYKIYTQSDGTAYRYLYLGKYVSGSYTQLAVSARLSIYFSYPCSFKFEAVGTTIRAKLWATAEAEPDWQVSVTDSAISSGKVALGASGNSGTYFDNISIESDDIPEVIQDPVGTLAVTGYDPVVDLDVKFSVSPLGTVAVAGYDPVVTFFGIVDPTLGSLVVTGKTPTVGIETPVVQELGSLTVAGYDPTVSVAAGVNIGTLEIEGFNPTVAASAAAVHLYMKFKDAYGTVWTREIDSRPTVTEVTTTHIADSTDEIILADATGGAFNVILPNPTGRNGFIYRVKKIDASANAVTVVGTIDEDSNFDLEFQDESITVTPDGTEWWII